MSIYKLLFQKSDETNESQTLSLSYVSKKFLEWISNRKKAIGEHERLQREEAARRRAVKKNRFDELGISLMDLHIKPFICRILESHSNKSFSLSPKENILVAHLEWNISNPNNMAVITHTGADGEKLEIEVPAPTWFEEYMNLYGYFNHDAEGWHNNVPVAKDFIKSVAKATDYRAVVQVYCFFEQESTPLVIRNQTSSMTINLFVCYKDHKRYKNFVDIQSEFA